MTRQELLVEVVIPTLEQIQNLFGTKGDEYAVTGAFHNFEEAVKQGRKVKNPIQALEGMKLKHDVSVRDILNAYDKHFEYIAEITNETLDTLSNKPSLEKINEKFDDILVYTILMKAMLIDFYQLNK